jgi:hypothetical protein
MPFANDMAELRHEIDTLHARRMAMMHRLGRFRSELHKTIGRTMHERHKAFAKECARGQAAREEFAAENHQMVEELLAGFASERSAGHRHFFGKRA